MGEQIVKETATDEQLREIRTQVEMHVKENGSASFDPRDLQKVKTNDFYVNRFFKHVDEMPGVKMTNVVNMIINTMKWRKETGIADIREDELSPSLMEKGVLYSKNRDTDGKKLLIFEVRKHFKGKEKMEDMKKYLLYFIERLDREENGDRLSLVFDCSGSGIRNMDMEFIQYMLGIFKEYVPDVLNYILVFEMPWVLNAAWKIIKSWLPAAAVRKIKFLNKSNMSSYVASEQLFIAWGGDFDWDYEFEREEFKASGSTVLPPAYDSLTPDPLMDEEAKKKVHFASAQMSNNNHVVENSSFASASSGGSPPALNITDNRQSMDSMVSMVSRQSSFNSGSLDTSSKNLLKLEPHDEIVFNQRDNLPNGDLLGKVIVSNITASPVAFKIKTTSPEKYRVRPSMNIIKSGGSTLVEIYVQMSEVENVNTLVKDKFLITAIFVEQENLSHAQIAEAVKSRKADAQYRLKCSLSADSFPNQAIAPSFHSSAQDGQLAQKMPKMTNATNAAIQAMDKQNQQITTLSKKVGSLSQDNAELKEELAFVKLLIYSLIVMVLILIIALFWRTPVLSAETCTNLLLHTAQANYLNDGILVNPDTND